MAAFIECPEGSYCPQGSVWPQPCPPGTYSNIPALYAEAQCTNCTAGFYCPESGQLILENTFTLDTCNFHPLDVVSVQ